MGVRLCATGPESDSLRQAVPLCVSSACALTLRVPVDDCADDCVDLGLRAAACTCPREGLALAFLCPPLPTAPLHVGSPLALPNPAFQCSRPGADMCRGSQNEPEVRW